MGFVGNVLGSVFGGLASGLDSSAKSNYVASAPPINTTNYQPAISSATLTPNFVDYSQSNQTEQGQQSLAQALLAQSQGFGPNPAAIAQQQGTNRAVQQAAGLEASQKGINTGTQQRLIAQNAASTAQQAAGQGAYMQAQQQLAAQGQLGQALAQQRQQDITQATQNKELQNQYVNTLYGAQSAQNQAITSGYNSAQAINAGVQAQNAGVQGQALGGLYNAAGGLASMGLGSLLGSGSSSGGSTGSSGGGYSLGTNTNLGQPMSFSKGGKIPGKAPVQGDHEANDTVPAMLSPGEIVVPRSHAGSADKAKEFIDKLKGSSGKTDHFAKVLAANKKLKQKVSELEKRKRT